MDDDASIGTASAGAPAAEGGPRGETRASVFGLDDALFIRVERDAKRILRSVHR
jgi:hypothetical protein